MASLTRSAPIHHQMSHLHLRHSSAPIKIVSLTFCAAQNQTPQAQHLPESAIARWFPALTLDCQIDYLLLTAPSQ
jgi:hypothetical protein